MTRVAVQLLLAASFAAITSAQTTDATYPVGVARMYGVSTARAWTGVQSVLKDLGFKIERIDERGRFVITQPVAIDQKRFGFKATDVVANASRGRVTLHIFVPRSVEPARVYVGSMVIAELQEGRQLLAYSPDAFGIWFFKQLAPKLAVPGHQIPQHPARRAALARSLLGGDADECAQRIEHGVPPITSTTNWMAPRKLHEVPAVFPRSAMVHNQERELLLRGTLGEDGFAWPVGVAGGSPTDDFATTAMGVLPLWRFAPMMIEGCPSPMPNLSVSIRFTLQR